MRLIQLGVVKNFRWAVLGGLLLIAAQFCPCLATIGPEGFFCCIQKEAYQRSAVQSCCEGSQGNWEEQTQKCWYSDGSYWLIKSDFNGNGKVEFGGKCGSNEAFCHG